MHVLPNKRRVTVVVGEPVAFPAPPKQRNENDDNGMNTTLSPEYVDECHAAYINALRKLYDASKAKAGYEDVPLEIV